MGKHLRRLWFAVSIGSILLAAALLGSNEVEAPKQVAASWVEHRPDRRGVSVAEGDSEGPSRCRMSVRVTNDHGLPVVGAIGWHQPLEDFTSGAGAGWQHVGPTDVDGMIAIRLNRCSVDCVKVSAPRGREEVVCPMMEASGEIDVVLRDRTPLAISVVDLAGHPVPSAMVSAVPVGWKQLDPALDSDWPEARRLDESGGLWRVYLLDGEQYIVSAVVPQLEYRLMALSQEYVGEVADTVSVVAGEDDAVELVLPTPRVVSVHCTGQEPAGCSTLGFLACGTGTLSDLIPCSTTGVPACLCPEGDAVVVGGGTSVSLGPDESDVILDLGFSGGVRGTVGLASDQRCVVDAIRLSMKTETGAPSPDLRSVPCGDDGSFEVLGLRQGYWTVTVRGNGSEIVPLVEVTDRVLDLGHFDLSGGAQLDVSVQTPDGQPLAFAPVVARLQGDQVERLRITSVDGVAAFGLVPLGVWSISSPVGLPAVASVAVNPDGGRVVANLVVEGTRSLDQLGLNASRAGSEFRMTGAEGTVCEGVDEGVAGVEVLGLRSPWLPGSLGADVAEAVLRAPWGIDANLLVEGDDGVRSIAPRDLCRSRGEHPIGQTGDTG